MGRKKKRRSWKMTHAEISRHYPLVYHIVNQLYPIYRYRLDQEEAIQAGMLGLMLAARYYRPRLGNQFSTYAYLAIKSQIISAVRDDYPIHIPSTAYHCEVGRQAAAKINMTHLPENDEELGKKEAPWQDEVVLRIDVARLLQRLDPRGRRVLSLAAGIDGPACSETMVASQIGVAKSRISQLKKNAYHKLRKVARQRDYL